jgi:hypothetical protein
VYKTHGLSKTPEYKCWQQIKARCLNSNHSAYPDYGGRGIGMDELWVNDFEAFYAHVGPRPSKAHSLDRKDNNLGYVVGNVRWGTWEEQANNRRKHGQAVGLRPPKQPGRVTNFKHGQIHTPEYNAWILMKDRCLNPKSSNYPYWGGRGITIYGPWVEDFVVFCMYVGHRPSPRHSLDRIDNNGNYEPGNVRWATKVEQNENRRPCKTGPDHGNFKHGSAGNTVTPEYKTWTSVKTRCFNSKSDRYESYGGAGITMCQRWKDSFQAFFEDLGPKPSSKYTVFREDRLGNYSCGKCPECLSNGWSTNCRWGSREEQNRNRAGGKLNEAKVATIRKMLAKGVSQKEVAKVFGVGMSLVGKIKRRENWA